MTEENNPIPIDPDPTGEVIDTPFTAIPDEYVGTWYAELNDEPMNTNWDQGTFQGEQGFSEFRTLVLTKDGKNAVEYTSEVVNVSELMCRSVFNIIRRLPWKTWNGCRLTTQVLAV